MKIYTLKKGDVAAAIFILVSLVAYAFFPTVDTFQQMTTMLVFFVVLPLLFNKIFLKKSLDFFGVCVGDWKKGLFWGAISLIIIGFIFFILFYYFEYLDQRKVSVFAAQSFGNFIYYEFLIVSFFVAVYEFYLRGFVMAIFKDRFKYFSILIQAVLFLILVLSIGGASIYLFLPYLIFAPFGGFIAYKSKSILYSGISQFLLIIILDAVSIKMLG